MIQRVGPPAPPGLPVDGEAPVFGAPWEAQAFAIVVALHEKGLFTWPEWAAALSGRIKAAQAAGDPDTGETYYTHWLTALEGLLAAKKVATPEAIVRYRRAWNAAAHRTPHGTPIELRAEDFAVSDPLGLTPLHNRR
jgi:nitrile hydratase accessory protein